MTFTLVFKSISNNLAYMLAFEPCPIWKRDSTWSLNLNSETPKYQLGSIRKLLDRQKLESAISEKECVIIIQKNGHGSNEDLENLKLDLEQEGFRYSICDL